MIQSKAGGKDSKGLGGKLLIILGTAWGSHHGQPYHNLLIH